MADGKFLGSLIRVALETHGPQTAKDLSKRLGFPKKAINSVLYAKVNSEFANDELEPPRWRVVRPDQAVEQPPQNGSELPESAPTAFSQYPMRGEQPVIVSRHYPEPEFHRALPQLGPNPLFLTGLRVLDEELITLIQAEFKKARHFDAPWTSPLTTLKLRNRTTNALGRKGITTVYQLLGLSAKELLGLPNVGYTTLFDVTRALGRYGLLLGQQIEVEKEALPRDYAAEELVDFIKRNPGVTFEICARKFGTDASELTERLANYLNIDKKHLRVHLATTHAEELGIPGSEVIESAYRFVSTKGSLDEPILAVTNHEEASTTREILAILGGIKTNHQDFLGELFRVFSKQRTFLRDQVIVNRRLKGQTLETIGTDFGLTRERVRQILIRELGPDQARYRATGELVLDSSLRNLRDHLVETKDPFPLDESWATVVLKSMDRLVPEDIDIEVQDLVRKRLQSLVNRNPGIDIRDLEEKTGLRKATIRTLIPSEVMRLTSSNSRLTTSSKWSDQELLELLQLAATYHFPLTGPKWDSLVQMGEIDGPSAQLVFKRFGSWSQACSLAGIEGVEPVRATYDRKWSRRDLEQIVIEYLTSEDAKGTYRDFELWLAQRDGYPSGPTLRNHLGNWSQMKLHVLSSEEMKEFLREQC